MIKEAYDDIQRYYRD
jgi:phospholipid-translocating ATPase